MCKFVARFSKTLTVVFACAVLASAQQLDHSYGFVSPNTREDLKLEDAIEGLSSTEEVRLINRAKSLRCIARSPIQAAKAIGSWNDGAEHSVVLRANSDSSTMRYLLSLLGRDNQQKAVLYFRTGSEGTATIYILRPQRHNSLHRLSDVLDRAGITFRTLIPQKRSAHVYVVDLKRELHSKIIVAARRLRVSVASRQGSAEFIGDGSSREKAKVVFDNEIRDYESKHSALVTKCQNRTTQQN